MTAFNQMSSEELGRLFPVFIVDYESEWKGRFLRERQKITSVSQPGSILSIEHIGSTAVPGLCAKPTIDILLIIPEKADCDLLVRNLRKINYFYIPKPENPPPHIMLAKGYALKGSDKQKFHIHIRYPGDLDEIVFRDYLIKNPYVANAYCELKKSLAVTFRNDRDRYTNAKTDFIRDIIRIAREELKNSINHIMKIKASDLEKLNSKDPGIKYGFVKELLKTGADSPELLYEHFEYWTELIKSKNIILKWTAIDIMGYISSVDRDNKTDKQIKNLIDLLHCGQLITCNHAIFALGRIAKNKPMQRTKIITELIKISGDNFETEECKAIATGKVIEALNNFKSEIQDNDSIIAFIRIAQGSQRNATRKKADALMMSLIK